MKKALVFLLALAAAVSFSEPAPLKELPVTNTVYTSQQVDAAIGAIKFPEPDWSETNDALVATIQAVAPPPGDYATVSNKAMTAVQTERDPLFAEWAQTNQIAASLAGKQATIPDLATIRAGAALGATAVQNVLTAALPSGVGSGNNIGGWISMADSFLGTLPSGESILTATTDGGNITRGYNGQNFTSLSINGNVIVTSNDSRLSDARPPTAHTHTAAQVTGLAAVATSGSYNDLTDKPAAPVETDPVALPLIAAAARAATNYTDAAIAAMPPPSGGADLSEVSNVVRSANTQLLAEAPDAVALASLKAIIADLWQRVDSVDGADGSGKITAAEAEAIVNARVAPLESMVTLWTESLGAMPVTVTNKNEININNSQSGIALSLAPTRETIYNTTSAVASYSLGFTSVSGTSANPCPFVIGPNFASVTFPSGAIVSGTYDPAAKNFYRVYRLGETTIFEKIAP